MASALLASRNEPCWGERKVYMRKYTNTTTNNPLLKQNASRHQNPNHNRQIHDPPSNVHFREREVSPAPVHESDVTASPNRKSAGFNEAKESSHGGYVTFNLGSYSRRELKELKRRLVSELEQVRNLKYRIESSDFGSGSKYPVPNSSMARPPPLQLNNAAESPKAEKGTPKANKHYQASDFLKGKKGAGTKRVNPFGSVNDPNPKRPAMDSASEKVLTSMMRRCGQILTKLMKHKFGWVFNTPVNAAKLGLLDYHQIIKNPMDLGSVKSNLEKDRYKLPIDFASDVRLTFNNAMTYNPKGQDVYYMAEQMLGMFNEMFNPAHKKFQAEQRRVLATPESEEQRQRIWNQTPKASESVQIAKNSSVFSNKMRALSNTVPVQVQPEQMAVPVVKSVVTPRSVKLPKPKAKDPNKREMSYEEKAKLGLNLQNLPSEKMDQLLRIIKKRNQHLAQDGDEIELDIEAVDTETLWELDRFVSNYKKMASKTMREGLMQNQMVINQPNKSPVSERLEGAGQKSKKAGEAAEEDVDIGEEIPIGNYPPVVIEKDETGNASSSSSSSSSTSGSSSSSGSDSGSSGSDSDADSVQSPFVEGKEAQ